MLVNFKKYLIFIVLLLVLLVVVFLKFFIKPTSRETPPPVAEISLSPLPEAPPGLNYSFEGKLPDVPQTLDTYQVSSFADFSANEAKNIAASFAFSGEPAISQDALVGNYYTWNTDDQYLSLGGKPPIISFGLYSPKISSSSAVLATKTAANLSEKTLTEKKLTSANIDLNNPDFAYFISKPEGLEQIQEATTAQIVRVSYNYKLGDLPLLNKNPSSPAISLFFGPDGQLLRLDYIKYPDSFAKNKNQVSLLTAQRAWENLKSNKGTIVYVMADKDLNSDIPQIYNINMTKVNNISLAYYYPNFPETTIGPIFVFEGQSPDASGNLVKVIVYLSAIKR